MGQHTAPAVTLRGQWQEGLIPGTEVTLNSDPTAVPSEQSRNIETPGQSDAGCKGQTRPATLLAVQITAPDPLECFGMKWPIAICNDVQCLEMARGSDGPVILSKTVRCGVARVLRLL